MSTQTDGLEPTKGREPTPQINKKMMNKCNNFKSLQVLDGRKSKIPETYMVEEENQIHKAYK